VALRLIYLIFIRLLDALALVLRSDISKDAEILVLRHQLAVSRRQVTRPKPSWADRALISALARLLAKPRRIGLLFTPDTLPRWHTDLVKRPLDLQTNDTRPTAETANDPRAGAAPRRGESDLGVGAENRVTGPDLPVRRVRRRGRSAGSSQAPGLPVEAPPLLGGTGTDCRMPTRYAP
jgi:hypothetical protein